MEFYLNNRQVIKNLSLNTGTVSVPVWSTMCTTSEIAIDTEFEKKDFYVFCDAVKRAVITGVGLSLTTTVKLDINNTAIKATLGNLHDLIGAGDITKFNNQEIEFDLLSGVSAGVLEYTRYKATVCIEISDLGGAAEDEGDYQAVFTLVGPATEQVISG